ncbi:MAG TPA: type 2 lanthipeptide synthetase LanM, partial [Ktedonobacteraceae bacterium]|nr:type 2 lanthipeptide synthetase LanM [Ktedonobacteraceae bacterium]
MREQKTRPRTPKSATGDVWQSPAWYTALSLAERSASRQAQAYTHNVRSEEATEVARERLQDWKNQKPFDHSSFFADRLALDGLTEQDLLDLLAEATAEMHARTRTPPDWLHTLREAFATPLDANSELWFPRTLLKQHPFSACLIPIAPLIHRALVHLNADVKLLARQYCALPCNPQNITCILLDILPQQLLAQLEKTLVLEMHVARLQHRLHGRTSAARFADFIRQLAQQDTMVALLAEYPVLARQLVLTIDHWKHYAREFIHHLCADWEDVCTIFTPDERPGQLVKVQGDVSEMHQGGRQVLILTFQSGLQLLYKPKSLAIDAHFHALLHWLNEHGVEPAFRTIKLLNRGDYGWSEFIYASSCITREEVARFYERQGSFLALLYALDATDFHADNIIAHGEHPILIDLEALFHPPLDEDISEHDSSTGTEYSVLRVGLLPDRAEDSANADEIDFSGLGNRPGQMTPHAVPQWTGNATDHMRIVCRRIALTASQNQPRLHGQNINLLDYRQSIVAGFRRMYHCLWEQRDELITEWLPRFGHDRIRVLLRPTEAYELLLTASFHPDLQRDALERDRFFDHLWLEVEQRPSLARVIAAEQHNLCMGDIPHFTTHPASRVIWTSDGEPLHDFLAEPGLERVKRHLQHFDEQDLATQIGLINDSLLDAQHNMRYNQST